MSLHATHIEGQPLSADGVDPFLQHIKPLAQEYKANLEKSDDIGFNLFELISDHYYRETFHSDILHALLDPAGKHQEQGKYLSLFLKFIYSEKPTIKISDYENARVEKEQGKVDVLILGKRNAIVIENKINNAGDMPRQLPRYLDYVKKRGYTCEAIIYLRLNRDAYPDTTGWSPEEKEEVKKLIIVVNAYNDTQNNLVTGWLRECEKASSNNSNAKNVLRQYGDLIKKLGGKIMNKPVLEKFYNIMVEGENLRTALSLKLMLEDLIEYRVEKIIDAFKNNSAPFQKPVREYNGAIFRDSIGESNLVMEVWAEPDFYLFQVLDKDGREGSHPRSEAILQKMGCLNEYPMKYGKFTFKEFKFPSQEKELFQHITDFKIKLAAQIEF
jgi:hypothetical protein